MARSGGAPDSKASQALKPEGFRNYDQAADQGIRRRTRFLNPSGSHGLNGPRKASRRRFHQAVALILVQAALRGRVFEDLDLEMRRAAAAMRSGPFWGLTEGDQTITRTLEAWAPFWPWVTSNSTFWFSSERKTTRLNSTHVAITYAVFCLKNK